MRRCHHHLYQPACHHARTTPSTCLAHTRCSCTLHAAVVHYSTPFCPPSHAFTWTADPPAASPLLHTFGLVLPPSAHLARHCLPPSATAHHTATPPPTPFRLCRLATVRSGFRRLHAKTTLFSRLGRGRYARRRHVLLGGRRRLRAYGRTRRAMHASRATTRRLHA